MADPVWLADVLRDEGLRVVEFPGWRERGHGDFGSIWGVICHHTGGSRTPASDIAYGRPDLEGPLSQLHLAQDGTVTVVAAGVAWHAGVGNYPGLPTNNANYYAIGIEAANNGTEGWSDAQYDAYVGCCAAILRRLGKGAGNVIGHKEWAGAAQGKWDPGAMDMNRFRADVQKRLGNPTAVRGAGTVWGELFENFKKIKVSYGTAIYYIDEGMNAIRDQVARGWKQLGTNDKGEPLTLIDALAKHKSDTAADLAEIKGTLAAISEKLEDRS